MVPVRRPALLSLSLPKARIRLSLRLGMILTVIVGSLGGSFPLLAQQNDDAAALAAQIARLREENARLKTELEELKHTRMLVPNPHNGEGSVIIGDRHYWLEYARDAGYAYSPWYRQSGDPKAAYYFLKPDLCRRLNPRKTSRPQKIPGRWPLDAVSPDGSHAIAAGKEVVDR